jgi:hypothetical protein
MLEYAFSAIVSISYNEYKFLIQFAFFTVHFIVWDVSRVCHSIEKKKVLNENYKKRKNWKSF